MGPLELDVETLREILKTELPRILREHPEVRHEFLGLMLEFFPSRHEFQALQEEIRTFREEVHQRFNHLEQRIDGMEQRMDGMEQRMDGMEQRMDRMEQRMDGMEQRMDRMEQRMDRMEQRLENVEGRLGNVEHRLENVEHRLENVEHRLDHVEERMEEGFREVQRAIDRLGSRWGIRNESLFRQTIASLLEGSFRAKVETRVLRGEQYDVIVTDSEHILLEIAASTPPNIRERLERKRKVYAEETGITPTRVILVTASIHSRRAQELREAGFEVIEPEEETL